MFVRPPCHILFSVSSPNSIPDERKDSWCAYVPLTSVLLQFPASRWPIDEEKCRLCLLEYNQWCSSVGNLLLHHIWRIFLHVTQYTLRCFACCVLWKLCWSDLCFPSSGASMSIIVLQYYSSPLSCTNYISCFSPDCMQLQSISSAADRLELLSSIGHLERWTEREWRRKAGYLFRKTQAWVSM